MGRNKEANQKMKEERREQILAGALELFALNGLAGTKISDIARHTGMSNGLIYHYFSSKEYIFTELIRIALDRLVEACGFLQTMDRKPDEKIKYAIDALVQTIQTKPGACLSHLLVTQAIAAKNIPHEAREILNAKRQVPYETIAEIMARGQRQGTIRQGRAEDLAFFFWVNINGIAQQKAMYGEKAQYPPLELLYHMFFTDTENTNA